VLSESDYLKASVPRFVDALRLTYPQELLLSNLSRRTTTFTARPYLIFIDRKSDSSIPTRPASRLRIFGVIVFRHGIA
jgi:hypothetical protein